MSSMTAEVQVLTAEVRVLMVGSRHGTYVGCVYVVGRHATTGALVSSRQLDPGECATYTFADDEEARSWAVTRSQIWPERPYRSYAQHGVTVTILENDIASLDATLPWPCNFVGSDEDGWRPDWRHEVQTWVQDEERYVPTPDVVPVSDDAAAEIDRHMAHQLAVHTAKILRYRRWQALPLIVLAGLR